MEQWNPNNEFKEVVLKGEMVDEFIAECLDMGNTLAQVLLRTKDIKKATKITLLPSGFDPTTIKNYSYGGVFPSRPASPEEAEKIRKHLSIFGPFAKFEAVESGPSRAWLISNITAYLSENEKRIVIFENARAEPTDPWILKTGTKIYAFQKEVYHGLLPEHASDNKYIEFVIKKSQSAHLLIGVMSLAPETLEPLSLSKIEQIAENAETLILRAFDGEGYVICRF